MHVKVRFFASYREVVGMSELELQLPHGSTVADAVSYLRRKGEPFVRLPEEPAVAVNQRYVRPSETLEEGDEVAFLPPVAGG